MGHGASVDRRWQSQRWNKEGNVIPAYETVASGQQEDRYRLALDWADQLLERERKMYVAADPTALYVQPLMLDKLERSFPSLDTVALSYGQDQQRCLGHVEDQAPALSGTVKVICPMGDDSTVACAAEDGLLYVYNWKEGRIVSTMRSTDLEALSKICVASKDYRYLAAGGKRGDIELWDISLPRRVFSERVHEQAITGLECDTSKSVLLTTSASQYITLYDLARTAVAESANIKIGDDGYGVPNSMLGFSEAQPKIMLLGGCDGKLRIWSKDDGPMTQLSSLDCNGGQPHRCRIASDGWRIVLGTTPAHAAFCAPDKISCGGLLTLDLRCLAGKDSSRAIISAWDAGPITESRPFVPKAPTTGIADLTLYEDAERTRIMCIVDNMVRAFTMEGLEIAEDFEVEARAAPDGKAHLTAIASSGRCVFVGTSTPSIGEPTK
jgi:hypothetical protein